MPVSKNNIKQLELFSPKPESSTKFTPLSIFPTIKSGLYINLLQVSKNNVLRADYSTLNISNYNIRLPYSITIEGDLYFAYDITIPFIPYFYCDEFNPKTFTISNISITNLQYPGTNINMYYFKLSINQVVQLKNLPQTFTKLRIYLSNPTPAMIANPVLENTIIFDNYTYKTPKTPVFPQLKNPLPLFLKKYDITLNERVTILTETFTGFDIFGQFNLIKIDEFGLNSNDIYKIIYMNNSSINNPMVSNYYYASLWTDKYVTPMLSDSSLNNQSVTMMNTTLSDAKFMNFTKNIKILASPYKYTFINYQYKFDPVIILSILQNGFNPTLESHNSLLDISQSTIRSIKERPPTPITELNDIQIYIGLIFCNSTLLDAVKKQINTWPKNAFEFNIAFFSYITYLMYNQINTTSSDNISILETTKNKIKVYKITTPFRMNSPFIYRVDIPSFITYLTNSTIKSKLLNYINLTSTLTIDLPTALLLSYYDNNPQSTTNQNTVLTPQALLNSYYANQSVLSGETVPSVIEPVNLPIANVTEGFGNVNINKELNIKNDNKINNQYVKYALF